MQWVQTQGRYSLKYPIISGKSVEILAGLLGKTDEVRRLMTNIQAMPSYGGFTKYLERSIKI